MKKILLTIPLLFVPMAMFPIDKADEQAETSGSSKVEERARAVSDIDSYEKFRMGGYGEIAASYMDYDYNWARPTGAAHLNRGSISIPRFILAFDYKFSSKWVLGAEIEFEYGGVGASKEIEWIEENVKFIVPDASDTEVRRALDISCASDFIDELPEGLKTRVGEKGTGLSEGQIQRIAIARALLSRAPVLLLDEATSALDEETEYRVLDNLKKIKDVTVIIISHKKAALTICNRCVQIKNRKVVEIPRDKIPSK